MHGSPNSFKLHLVLFLLQSKKPLRQVPFQSRELLWKLNRIRTKLAKINRQKISLWWVLTVQRIFPVQHVWSINNPQAINLSGDRQKHELIIVIVRKQLFSPFEKKTNKIFKSWAFCLVLKVSWPIQIIRILGRFCYFNLLANNTWQSVKTIFLNVTRFISDNITIDG